MGGQYYNVSQIHRYQYEGLGSIGSGWGLLESPYEFDFEPPGSISYGVS